MVCSTARREVVLRGRERRGQRMLHFLLSRESSFLDSAWRAGGRERKRRNPSLSVLRASSERCNSDLSTTTRTFRS